MAAIDCEAEYNVRVRVPEHPQIFAGWACDAEDYRTEMLERDRAELGLSYGDTPRQILDPFLPEARNNTPLALFVHGGYWRTLDPSSFLSKNHFTVIDALADPLSTMVARLAELARQMNGANSR